MHRRIEKNRQAHTSHSGILFDPSVTSRDSLADCFRVFLDLRKVSYYPAYRLERPAAGVHLEHEHLTVHTNGHCIHRGKANAKTGSGVFISPESPYNRSIRLGGPAQSTQAGEIAAIVAALQVIPPFTPVTFATDSLHVINGLTKNLNHWEDSGWVGVSNRSLFQAAAYQLRLRSAATSFSWVGGHNRTPSGAAAHDLAKQGATKTEPDELDLNVPPAFNPKGMKLSCLTQTLAYRAIRERRTQDTEPRTKTAQNISRALDALQAALGTDETEAQLWLACRSKSIQPLVRQFTYKIYHGAYRIGDHWEQIPGYSDHAPCTVCRDVPDNMDHILTECNTPARKIVWLLAQDLWPAKNGPWPSLDYGAIIAPGTLKVYKQLERLRQERGPNPAPCEARQLLPGASRLLQILVSESKHLIWTLRCERVIRGHTHSPSNIVRRWTTALNRQLSIDRIIATKLHRSSKAIRLILRTWGGTIADEDSLPPDRVGHNGFLVGIRTPRLLSNGESRRTLESHTPQRKLGVHKGILSRTGWF
ncbi:hypothetical protein GLOTRDRAFT_48720 [Gloeophyllum trabeum ATCC 11539]|uniref:ribonuclease H n=1 Tax=Gloeophyllum trabeum (strain ATCC 11539 / FP-39264 / Madison 617) TaxID=670483 RepID=S7PVD9_GLOTA|nr:uncharacterized protein GLOTRDRAFT_48720 [Gloeophyllum trabeum ATCC 11539]EPQ51596.1 hypothetical protein GLOTRDRAFT_48720 [Gloeophyllum trabeum ATCC 11539]